QIERGENRRFALFGRIPRADLLELGLILGGVDEDRTFLGKGPSRLMPAAAVIHRGMKTHRSTSPITTSVDPITAIRSATRPPTTILPRAWHARNEGARDFTRIGRFDPSDTM